MIRTGAAPLLLALGLLATACSPGRPTPYQPLTEPAGGYEETRLQEDMYRVSFRGNRHTAESDVIDFLYLRCAELALAAGYSHFAVVERFGKVGIGGYVLTGPVMGGGGIYSGPNDPFWGVHGAYGYPQPSYVAELDHHLAMFVVRLHRGPGGEEAAAVRMDARFLVDNLEPKRRQSQASHAPGEGS